jgi:hypothetical protein
VNGVATGRVGVGRFVLEVGAPAGTRAAFVPGQAAASVTPLASALAQPQPPPEPLAEVEQALDETESVTGRVEHALELFTALAQGRIDRKIVLKEVDVLLGVLERLDRQGRHRDALRLARSVVALLALLGRWVALVETLRLALRAAHVLGDVPGVAWARHELGTLALGVEDAAAANTDLDAALRMREELGDEAGAEVTRHNLAVLRQALGPAPKTGPRPVVVAAIVAGFLLLVVGGVAGALALRGGDESPPAADTVAPEVEITEGPDDPTEETSATFEFEADEPVQTYECRLDDEPFEECVSPQNFAGPLSAGVEHVFFARAADLAGNLGESATYRWTIEAGAGPSVRIGEHPDELTNEMRATFTVESPGAVSIECSRDGGEFEACSSPISFDVDEGEHEFAARGVNAADVAGPPARFAWTVDTTPPTVEIKSFDVTTTTAVFEFEPSDDGTVECTLVVSTDPPDVVESDDDCANPKSYEGLNQGTAYVFSAVATDLAGNVGEAAEQEFKTDTQLE